MASEQRNSRTEERSTARPSAVREYGVGPAPLAGGSGGRRGRRPPRRVRAPARRPAGPPSSRTGGRRRPWRTGRRRWAPVAAPKTSAKSWLAVSSGLRPSSWATSGETASVRGCDTGVGWTRLKAAPVTWRRALRGSGSAGSRAVNRASNGRASRSVTQQRVSPGEWFMATLTVPARRRYPTCGVGLLRLPPRHPHPPACPVRRSDAPTPTGETATFRRERRLAPEQVFDTCRCRSGTAHRRHARRSPSAADASLSPRWRASVVMSLWSPARAARIFIARSSSGWALITRSDCPLVDSEPSNAVSAGRYEDACSLSHQRGSPSSSATAQAASSTAPCGRQMASTSRVIGRASKPSTIAAPPNT